LKRFISFILAFVLAFSAIPSSVIEANALVVIEPVVVASGYCGNEGDGVNLKWSIGLNGLLTISGTGEMRNYSDPSLAPWNGYLESITAIEIEDGVTSIGDNAFSKFENIEGKVDFPESIEYIGENSFRNCGINEYHFFGDAPFVIEADNEIASFDVSEDIIYFVGEKSGWEKDSEGKWNGYNIESLYYAKGYCGASNGGKNLEWTLTENGTLTISGKGKMTDYDLDNKIAPWTKYPDMLKTLVLEEGITTIGNFAFCECGFTGELIIPNGVTNIGEHAFAYSDFNGDLVIPDSVIVIGGAAFNGCNFTGSLSIGNGVTTIEEYAFLSCSEFSGNLTIGNSVTTIGGSAFGDCTGFTGNLVIPKSVTAIGGDSFGRCGIDNYYFEGDAPVVSSATAEYPSFDEVDIIHYYSYTNGWELDESGKWNGYNAIEREAGIEGTFSPNGAEGTEFSVFYNEKLENGKYSVTLPDCYFVKTDSYFDSWKINGKFYSAGETIEVSEDFSAVPKWKYFGEKTEYIVEEANSDEIFVEPKGKIYHICLDSEQPYENIEIASNGIVEAKYIEFDPKTMSVSGALSAVYKVYDKDKKIDIATGLSYEEAFAKANEYNALNFSASGIIVAENYVHIIEVKVGENYSADYKEGNFKINATLDGVELSGKITVISDVYLKYVADTLESSNEVNADAAFLKENFIKLESAKTVKSTDNAAETEEDAPYDFIVSINIDEWPDKTVYRVGDTIDLTGMEVTAVAYKLNEETRMYEPFETDVTDLCWAEPSIVKSGEAQNISVYLKAPGDIEGHLKIFEDHFRITVVDEYGNDYELGEIEPIYENLEMNYGKDSGYSAYLGNDQAANEDTPATVFQARAFRLVSGGKVVVNGDNFVLEIPEVSENQNGINFYHETTPVSIKFFSDTIMQSDYTINWNLGMNYYELREYFGIKVEEDDVVSYYIYNDNNECLGKYSVDYMTADIEEEASFFIKEKAGEKLCGYTVSIEPPEGSENVPEMNNIASGYCGGEGDGTNLIWTLDSDGTLTISGNGAIENYELDYVNNAWGTTAPWFQYSDKLKKLVIEEGVTIIGNYAFRYCYGFTGDLVIPDSVTTIGDHAFDDCSGFTGSLVIPDRVTNIGNYAFRGCRIYDCCFEGDAPSIGEYYFGYDPDSKIVYYPKGNDTWIITGGKWDIYTAVEWDPECPVVSGYCGAEGNGTNLRWEISKNGVLTISGTGKMANFASEYENNRYITTAPWGDYRYRIKTLVIGEKVTNIGDFAFYGCDNLRGDLVIPNGIKTIGKSAFGGCYGFRGSLLLGNIIISIGDGAFSDCSGLNGNLVIPESVMAIGEYAFFKCSGFIGSLAIPDNVMIIGNYAFTDCTGFNGNLTIGNNVEEIGNCAFENCSGFTGSLVIPNNVKYIYWEAFNNCSGFDGSLTLGNGLQYIGEHVFYGCSGFKGNLIIPNSVTSIGWGSFSGCSGFDGNLVFGCSLEYIGESAFDNCSGFKGDLIIPDSVSWIGSGAFYYSTGFDGKLEIGSNVQEIGSKAFYNCTGFTGSLVVPENVGYIGGGAFYYCGINDYYFKGNAPTATNISSGDRSFDFDDTIYYPFGNTSWKITNGKWNGYTAKDWTPKTDAYLTVSSGIIAPGKTKKFTVDLSEHPETAMIQFTLKYDPSVLEVVSCSEGNIIEDATVNYSIGGEISFVWESLDALKEAGTILEIEFKAKTGINPQKTVVGIDRNKTFVFKCADKTDIAIDISDGIIVITKAVYGDINLDGVVDVMDAYTARLVAAKLIAPTEEQILLGDVDNDGRITAIDANIIRKFVVKIITKIPVEM